MKKLTANEITHDDIVKEVSKELGIDKRVVDVSCHHFFQLVSEYIRDTENVRPIRLRYLGVFAIRGGLKKK